MSEGWEKLNVDGSTMDAFLCTPECEGPSPAMVVVQHAPGVDGFIQEVTRRLAAAGYASIAPDFYHREDPNSKDHFRAKMERMTDENIFKDVNAAVEFLRTNQLATQDIGITGFCLGGRVSLLMAGTTTIFKAAVPFYAAFMMGSWGEGPTPFERLANIKCPVLGFFGEEDENPTLEDMWQMDAEMTRHGVPHEFHSYANAGHGYMNFNNPNMYQEHAAQASWPLFLAFLEKHLKKASVAAD